MSEQDTKREAHGQKCLDAARKSRFEGYIPPMISTPTTIEIPAIQKKTLRNVL